MVETASFDNLLSRAGLEHLGKDWIVRDTTTRRLPYWANGLLTDLKQAVQLISSIIAHYQALT